ncbi:MAG: aldehyde dehydrogenase family protein, partial [Planctomycetota bacterium]
MPRLLPSLLPRTSTPLPRFVAGRAEAAGTAWDVPDRAAGGVLAQVHGAGPEEVERAIAAAERCHRAGAPPAHVRKGILERLAARVAEHSDALAELITRESGKPLRDARGEVARAQTTLTLAAEACARPSGAHWPLDATP